ncbi:hypothetical protein ACROYT_G035335 [Oculina patagonica]
MFSSARGPQALAFPDERDELSSYTLSRLDTSDSTADDTDLAERDELSSYTLSSLDTSDSTADDADLANFEEVKSWRREVKLLRSEVKTLKSLTAFRTWRWAPFFPNGESAHAGKEYTNLQEVYDALTNREVKGMLIDAFTVGSKKELFNRRDLRISKLLDYSAAYGVVLGGEAKKHFGYVCWIKLNVGPKSACSSWFSMVIFL